MRNGQYRSGEFLNLLLEPAQGFQIEVVGGLIEHQQVGLHHQQAGEVGPHDPAPAQGVGGLVKIFRMKSEPAEYLLGLGFEVVAFEFGKFFLGIQSFLAVWVRILSQSFQGLGEFGGGGGGKFKHGLLTGRGTLLRQVSDPGAALPFNLSLFLFFLSQKNREEGGLPGTVGTNQSHLLTPHHPQGNFPKENFRAEALADVGEGEHRKN